MTHPPIPPEDSFDAWLNDLVDGTRHTSQDENAAAARYLHDHFGLPSVEGTRLSSRQKAEIRNRVFANSVPESEPVPDKSPGATGIIVSPANVMPLARRSAPWHIASIVSAAVLVLIAVAMIGAVLRLNEAENVPGVSATASMMPFAPASALASPTPVAGCTPNATLLLIPESPVEPDAFADLPFPVAWYQDGLLTVERQGKVVRKIEIGDADDLRATSMPNIVFATNDAPDPEGVFVNIDTGASFEIGPYQSIRSTEGPFVFWASDPSFTRWHVADLRTFTTVDLSRMFAVTPLQPWIPYTSPITTSDAGSVLLVGTTTYDPVNSPVIPATPVASDGPELRISRTALLINGDLDDISVVGPLAPTSGAITLSPDGETMAWLAPRERAGERILNIADTATGDVIHTQPVEATYSNSLLFNEDGSVLYSTSGETLERIAVPPDAAPPVAALTSITLPDTAYHIRAASPDRTKLLLARTQTAAGQESIWLDLGTGEMRVLEGTLGRMFVSQIPNVASSINGHVLLDDLESEVTVLDMNTGEPVATMHRKDGAAMTTISADGSVLLMPHEDSLELRNLDSGAVTTWIAPDDEGGALSSFTISSDGSCIAGNWPRASGGLETVLLMPDRDMRVPLPMSAVGGWVQDDEGTHSP